MVRVDPLEAIETAALAALHEAAPPSARDALGARLESVDGATVSIVAESPSIVVNRAIGLGVGRPARPDAVPRIVDLYRDAGVARFYVHVHPDARPDDLAERLEEAGLEKARGWMKFTRDTRPPEPAATDLEVREIDEEHAADFGRIAAAAFDLGEPCGALVAALVGRPDVHAFMAFEGDAPAAGAVLFVSGDHGWLDWASTDPAFRRRGAQRALLAARIARARAIGLRCLFTETGESIEGDPQHSWHNIERAGFRPTTLRENWAPIG